MKDAKKPVLLQLCQGTPGRHAVDRKLFRTHCLAW